ncbi:MAG: PAS domain S-box protein, partial [Desulfobacteraceae bacterium]|nr:PAS domain S-box protein [Desulfobacteraceae bacterium]
MKLTKILIPPLFLVGICGFLLHSAYQEVKERAIDQLNSQQMVMAETASRGIETFFNHYAEVLNQLSKIKHISSLDAQGRDLIQMIYRAHGSEIRGISRVDASGRIIYTYPEVPGVIGADLSSQGHVKTLLETHQAVTSDVFDAVQGYMTIAIHVPVFENEEFKGSLAILIAFDQLSRNFLETIKVGKDGYAWIISNKGTELYCPVPGHIGKSVFENCADFPSILSMAREMIKGNRGTAIYQFDRVRNESVETLEKQAVYVPVHVGNTFWSIVVATPAEEVLDNIQGFQDRWFLVIAVLLLTAIFWTSYVWSTFKIVEEAERRRRAETALKESEEKYRDLVESANSIILRIDVSGKVIFLNEFAQRFFGYNDREMAGRDVIGTIFPASESSGPTFPPVGHDTAVNPNGHGSTIFETMLRNGEQAWVAWTSRPILDSDGKVVEVLCIGNDITDRKRAEEALRESEAKFRRLVTRAPLPLCFLNKAGYLTYINDRFVQAFGYAHDDIPTMQTWWQLAFPDESYRKLVADSWQNAVRRATEDETDIEPIECRITCKDGRVRIIEMAGIAIGEDFVANFVDITERKRAERERRNLEERLQRVEKMEALGTLAGGVAHDLNNVLGIIVGYSELFLYELDNSHPHRHLASQILKGGQRAAAIVQDLLTLARRGVPSRSVVNLNTIIVDCLASAEFEKLCSFHPEVEIRRDLEPDLLNQMGSADHLGKSFMNLLSNAAEAMPQGGVLTVRTSNCYLDKPIIGYDDVREGDYIVLSVSDTGGGIAAADLKRIFEPFYTKKAMGRSGTGLGLAVVWGTVKDHSGYINVESRESEGTTFTLYFPVTREELVKGQDCPSSVAAFTGNGESVLVVDDVREQRELAEMILKRLNYSVECVPSGEEAVEYLRSNKADLVILDMIM